MSLHDELRALCDHDERLRESDKFWMGQPRLNAANVRAILARHPEAAPVNICDPCACVGPLSPGLHVRPQLQVQAPVGEGLEKPGAICMKCWRGMRSADLEGGWSDVCLDCRAPATESRSEPATLQSGDSNASGVSDGEQSVLDALVCEAYERMMDPSDAAAFFIENGFHLVTPQANQREALDDLIQKHWVATPGEFRNVLLAWMVAAGYRKPTLPSVEDVAKVLAHTDGGHHEALFDAGHESTIALYMRHATAVLDLLKRGA